MTKATTFANSRQPAAITRIERPSKQDLILRMTQTRQPFIFAGNVGHWPASRWTPEYFAKTVGETMVRPLVDLPRHGMPYFWNDKDYSRTMRMMDLVTKMVTETGSQCYLAQKDIKAFPPLMSDFDFGEVTPKLGVREPSTSFWMGTRGTHSGLHFDRRDNVLVQIHGHKQVILAAPEEARNLYQISDMFEKSSVDPVNPDLSRHPRFRDARLHQGVIGPGDVLFIPQLWWHYLESRDLAISLNHWYGDECSLQDLARMMSAGGAPIWATVVKDAFWYGICKRPYRTRLRSDMPSGLFMYVIISNGIKRRIGIGS